MGAAARKTPKPERKRLRRRNLPGGGIQAAAFRALAGCSARGSGAVGPGMTGFGAQRKTPPLEPSDGVFLRPKDGWIRSPGLRISS